MNFYKKIILLSAYCIFTFVPAYAQKIGITNTATFTPNYLLHIYDNNSGSGTLMQLTNTTTLNNATTSGFAIGIDATKKVMLQNQDNATLSLFTNGSERMTILGGGNVGINNNSPTNILDVLGGAARTGTHATSRALYVTGTFGANSTGVEFRHDNGTQGIGFGYNTIYATGSNASQDIGLQALGATGNLNFTTNALQRMIILGSNGNVGIGITNPVRKLDVTGDINYTGALYANSSAGTTGQLLLSAGGATNTWLPVGTSGQLLVSTGATPGWQSVSTALNNTAWLTTKNTGLTDGTNNLFGTTDAIPIRILTSNTERIRITSAGDVGIGATSPGAKLDVQGATGLRIGNSTYDANLVFGNNASWKSGIRVYDNGDAEMRIWHANTLGQIVLATGYNGDQSVSMPTDGLFIDQNKVGIGYASPASATGKLLVNGNVGIGTTSPSVPLDVTGTSTIGIRYIKTGTADARITIGDPTQSWSWATGWATGGDFSLVEEGTSGNRIYVKRTTGNVGIGISNPLAKLHVFGGSQTITSMLTDGYAEDISGIIQGNYIPSHTWTISSGSIGIFNENGAGDNVREWGDGPYGNRVILWKASGVSNADDGGWNTNTFIINNAKTYRVSLWIKKTGSIDGTTYLGVQGSNITYLNGTGEGNPYFWCGDLPVLDRWYLLVGYIHGSGDASTSHYGGIYDGVTRQKVVSFTGTGNCNCDFKFNTSATTQQQRAYLYYNSTGTNRQYFWDPRFEEVNGKELPVSSLLPVSSGNYIENQYTSAQSASYWISGESRTGGWFRNSTAGVGLYNEATGSGIYSPSANLMTLYNASSLQITSASTSAGNLRFDAANPYITASSYYICPGGAYFNSGTVYTEAQYQCRGGIHNDANAYLTIAGGTSATTYFTGNVGIGTSSPGYTLDLNGGTFGFGSANQRTQTRDNAGLQGNAGAQSGFFETSAPSPAANWPVGASSWWHMIDCRHSNTSNNYALQIAGSFWGDDLYYRKTQDNPARPWLKILSSANNPVSVSLASDYTVNAASWTTIAPMSVTFTATKTTALVEFTCSGFAYTNSMAYVQFRIWNSTLGASVGGTNTTMQSYDDLTGTVTPWSCAFSKNISGLTPGTSYTLIVQAQRYGILGTWDAAIYAASMPDEHHMTLTVFP